MRKLLRNVVSLAALGAVSLSAPLHGAAPSVAEAARSGDHEAVRASIARGGDVNAALGDGMTALHWSAVRNDVEMASLLLEAGASLELTTRLGGYTPLLLAAKEGFAAMMSELVKAGANPNAATTNGTTALMFAAASGQVDGVRALLTHGAAVNAKEKNGQTPLMFAASRGRSEVIDVLIAAGAEVNASASFIDLTIPPPAPPKPEPGRVVVSQDDDQLGRAGGNYRDNLLRASWGGLTALHFAVRQGHMESVKALLARGANVNQPTAGHDRTPPLLIATINGEFDIAKYLLEKGADPNAASENGVTAVYATLNCQWATGGSYPHPRAQLQQRTTYLELLKALLDQGANPNARLNKRVWYGEGSVGATPFWRAASAADVDAMRLLVSHGADPHISTMKAGERRASAHDPGQIATMPGYVSPLPRIPIGGPDVSPLLAALNSSRMAPTGMLPAVKYLVDELHLDVNAADDAGKTPLHQAAFRGDNEMILYLVSKGADPLAVTRDGLTTVDMANGPEQKIQPFPDTIALLEKLGAKNNHLCVSC